MIAEKHGAVIQFESKSDRDNVQSAFSKTLRVSEESTGVYQVSV